MSLKHIVCCCVLSGMILGNSACKKDNTYRSGQIATKVNANIYDYLSKQKENFDTLLYIIDKAGLTDTLKKNAVTFIAPVDQSIAVAMQNLNLYRKSHQLAPATLDSVAPFVWRTLLLRYMIAGNKTSASFSLKDGIDVSTLNRRRLHMDGVQSNTEGVVQSGAYLLKYSDLNGSRFVRDWIFSYVNTADIQCTNGVLHVLEPTHVFAFKSFVEKTTSLQNKYSDYYLATGTLFFPTGTNRPWYDRLKSVSAVDSVTCDVEGADLLSSSYIIRMKVAADNKVTVTPAPKSANQTLSNDGDCRYDEEMQAFVLHYKYVGSTGNRHIDEVISLRNF
ncbi:BT_3044 domain-containing protein [Chitinophaga sp. RAB17]|uniref:BT_3044 domain-containing protein n=1 Tax=Chitinophaga sp. RAB17 TaxID=3233049 RepID=UPI003F91103F